MQDAQALSVKVSSTLALTDMRCEREREREGESSADGQWCSSAGVAFSY